MVDSEIWIAAPRADVKFVKLEYMTCTSEPPEILTADCDDPRLPTVLLRVKFDRDIKPAELIIFNEFLV